MVGGQEQARFARAQRERVGAKQRAALEIQSALIGCQRRSQRRVALGCRVERAEVSVRERHRCSRVVVRRLPGPARCAAKAQAQRAVALDQPVCVASETEGDEFNEPTEKPIARIQLAGEAAGKDLPLGKHVKVSGTLFGAHTMWHVEDVLIDAADVTAD